LLAFSSSPSGTITLNQNTVTSRLNQAALDAVSDTYINIETTLADSQAIQINAASPDGGILIEAGFGGIAVNTTNAISLNAEAGSNFSTTNGNILLQSQPALVDIDGGSGINIGCDNNLANTSTPIITSSINIGTSSSAKTITIGNTTGATEVIMESGSAGISLNASSGQVSIVGNNSADNAISIDASSGSNGVMVLTGTGGFTLNSGTGQIEIVTDNTNVDAIRLDTSGGNGGILLAAGSNGISIGNDGVAHPITIGNTTGTTNVTIQSGSYGISIGNDNSGGEIVIANGPGAKTVIINNNLSGSALFTRWQTGWVKHQEVPIALSNSATTLTASQLLNGLFVGPSSAFSGNVALTLDSASNIISTIGFNAQDNDAFDFTIVNTSSATDLNYNLIMDSSGTMFGNNVIYPVTNSTSSMIITYNLSGSATFRLVINVTNTTYTVYRLS